MWTLLAFLFLGFLVGNLAGITAESVTSSLLALLFAFGGGSAIAFVHKLDSAKRKLASQAVVVLSIGCLVGTYLGIYVTERQLLTPTSYRTTPEKSSIELRKVLRAGLVSQASMIDQLHKSGTLSAEKAYETLYETIMRSEATEK